MDLYAENILDHYRHPRCKQMLDSPTVEHEEANHSCGDVLTLQLTLEDGRIKEVGWSGIGCAISQASMSMLTEELEEMTTEEVVGLSQKDIYDMLGVPIGPRRFKCALLSLHTLKNALRKTEGKEPQSWVETVAIKE